MTAILPVTTAVTDQVFKLAEQAGLRPQWREPYRSTRDISLSGEGVTAPFGTIKVGAASGKVLRAEITFGNGGKTRKFQGAVAVRAALRDLVRGR